MDDIYCRLYALRDEGYAKFQSGLIPGVETEKIIGVRVPVLRKFAASFMHTDECERFLRELPHAYYEENMLHAILIGLCHDYDRCVSDVNDFLPYVDNWSVCDTLRPKAFSVHRVELIDEIKKWIRSDMEYTCRFGIEMLMIHFLGDDFNRDYLLLAENVKPDGYYVKMMQAWFYATALAEQWDSTIAYLDNNYLSPWVHRKTVQKACESLRLSDGQKAYLKKSIHAD